MRELNEPGTPSEQKQRSVRLFVSVFRSDAGEIPGLVEPVSAGAALYPQDAPKLKLTDDEGEHISDRNPQYCELTVQYQVWKNRSFDTAGLMHQRRYFDFSAAETILSGKTPKCRPYRIFDRPDEQTLRRIGMKRETVAALTAQFPVIAPLKENIGCSVAAYYDRHDRKEYDDLGLLRQILKERYPDYLAGAEEYLNGHASYFCNLFIMDRDNFDRYSRWLFDVLFTYDSLKPSRLMQPREQGKLAERLFGVYMSKLFSEKEIPVCELPRAHFAKINGVTAHNLSFHKGLYVLAPPGSRRRNFLRKLRS